MRRDWQKFPGKLADSHLSLSWYPEGVNSPLASARRWVATGLPVSGLLVATFSLSLLAVRVAQLRLADRFAGSVVAHLVSWTPGTGESTLDAPVARRRLSDLSQVRQPVRSRGGGLARGIRITSTQVLVLAARRTLPQALPVKANAQHPAGLLLRGVSAWGVGLQDGDVLTEAAGQKASSVAVVVGVVLAARGRQVPEISGRFFRAGTPFTLIVEQPYPKEPLPG